MRAVIRQVEVELLRRGDRHNQLLSPLTSYLAVCGHFPAGQVTVPYDQSEAQNKLDDLRYTVSSADNTERLTTIRNEVGTDLAEMLAKIPGLSGTLATDRSEDVALTHLRMVTSANELALLPFEMSKTPVGSGGAGEDWLLLQADRPVCLTRHIRGVARASAWPTEPRILFVSGADVPFDAHLDVFERVLAPYRQELLMPMEGRPRHQSCRHLTVIEEATLEEIRDITDSIRFTHVHVLAHGAEIEQRRSVRYGLALGDRIVTGNDLALALASSVAGDRHIPSVVTLASCDSAQQGSLTSPGGSVAHDLHASGIPLVVGSQFPISQEASIPFTETFYRGQLNGEHPLASITDMRRQLATDFNDEHAWASVVVYEALPINFQRKLDELQYWQTRRAQDIALERLEQLATSDIERVAHLRDHGRPLPEDFVSPSGETFDELVTEVLEAGDRLPTTGAFAVECGGLRAAATKRIAEVAYWLSRAPDVTVERRDELVSRCLGELEVAHDLYADTVRSLLATTDGRVNRKVTMHWIVGQVLIMQAILGATIDRDLIGIAKAGARFDLDHADRQIRAWATVSLVEQAILQLAIEGPSQQVADRALECAGDLVRSMGEESEQVTATCRQMRRFVSWWGDADFVELERGFGIERSIPWDAPHGVVPTARDVLTVLTPPRHSANPRRRYRPRATSPHPAGPETTSELNDATLSRRRDRHAERTGNLSIEMLPARNGDSLWVSFGDDAETHHLLIDCGSKDAAATASARVLSVAAVELFILTHIDADHITGAIPLFGDRQVAERFDDVWFNGWEQLRGFLSVAQGEEFSALLGVADRSFRWNMTEPSDDPPPPIIVDGAGFPDIDLKGGMRLTVLSPTRRGLQRLASHWHAALLELDPPRAMLARRSRPSAPPAPGSLDLTRLAGSGPTKDASVPNLSSIAVLAEYGGRAVLFTGDAHADVLTSSIEALQRQRGMAGERLRLDALKLSHHGSANATTKTLLDTIECSNYLVPTDGSFFYHPDREAIARVIVHGGTAPALYFNYRTDLNDYWANAELQERYGYSTVYPTDDEGLTVEL